MPNNSFFVRLWTLRERWLPLLLICGLTFLVFSPCLQNGFVDWDDDKNFIHNMAYRGLAWPYLQWMWSRSASLGVYIPLTWMTNGLDYVIWGMNPLGYHLGNLILHMANAGMVYLLFRRLIGKNVPAFIGSLLFALHPLRVESVAWATERRDVLAAFFLLLCVWCYVRYVDEKEPHRARRWFYYALLAYVLSLFSKASGMTLAFVLFGLDLFPLRRLGPWSHAPHPWRGIIGEKLAFLGLALPISGIAAYAAIHAGATAPLHLYAPSQRLALACYGFIFYLRKTCIPLHLSPFYQLPLHVSLMDPPFIISFCLALLLTVGFFLRRNKSPALWIAWFIYISFLLPLTGLFQSGPTRAADHISYLSCLPWAAVAAAALSPFTQNRLAQLAAALVVLFLSLQTWQQAHVWRDTETLWRRVLAVEPDCAFAHNNLGNYLVGHGHVDEGIDHLNQAMHLRLQPEMLFSMGVALQTKGNLAEAVPYYLQAIQFNFDTEDLRYMLASALLGLGRTSEAIIQYEAALQKNPANAFVHNNLGSVLLSQQRYREAAVHFNEAIRLIPGYADAYNNLGVALASQSQFAAALPYFAEAYRLNPALTTAQINFDKIQHMHPELKSH